jgi:aromatic ring hydroxylase
MRWASHAGGVHVIERYKLFIGVAHLLAQTGGTADRPRVQEELGELCTLFELLRQSLDANEAAAEMTPGGLWAPRANPATRSFAIMIAERMCAHIEHAGTGSLIFNNSSEDFAAPELAPLLDLYGRGKDVDARQRQKLVRLAFELVGDAFGSRQRLYERLHSGDPYLWMGNVYRSYDKRPGVDAVNRLLGTSFQA